MLLATRRKAGRYRIHMDVGFSLSETQLRNYFSQFGTLLDVYLPVHQSGRLKGFGFATYENKSDLLRVLETPEHFVSGSIVRISRAGPRPEFIVVPPKATIKRSPHATLAGDPGVLLSPDNITIKDWRSMEADRCLLGLEDTHASKLHREPSLPAMTPRQRDESFPPGVAEPAPVHSPAAPVGQAQGSQAGINLAAQTLASFHLSGYSPQKGTASSLALHLAQHPSKAAAGHMHAPYHAELAVQGLHGLDTPARQLKADFSCHMPAAPQAGLQAEPSTLSFAMWQQQGPPDALDLRTQQSVGWLPAAELSMQGAGTAGQQELEKQPSQRLTEQQLALPPAQECSTPLQELGYQLAKQSQDALQGYALLQCVGMQYQQQQEQQQQQQQQQQAPQPALQGQASPWVAQLQANLPVRLSQQGIPVETPFIPHYTQ